MQQTKTRQKPRWLVKILGNPTPEQAAALMKALLVIGIALVTKTALDMWPSVGTTIARGAIFAAAIILLLRYVKATPSLQEYKPWFIPLGAGAFLNWLVVLGNGGFMPSTVEPMPDSMYIPMAGSNLPYLGDWIFGFISPGDMVLFATFAGVVITMIVKRDRSSPSAESAKAGAVSATPARKEATLEVSPNVNYSTKR